MRSPLPLQPCGAHYDAVERIQQAGPSAGTARKPAWILKWEAVPIGHCSKTLTAAAALEHERRPGSEAGAAESSKRARVRDLRCDALPALLALANALTM